MPTYSGDQGNELGNDQVAPQVSAVEFEQPIHVGVVGRPHPERVGQRGALVNVEAQATSILSRRMDARAMATTAVMTLTMIPVATELSASRMLTSVMLARTEVG